MENIATLAARARRKAKELDRSRLGNALMVKAIELTIAGAGIKHKPDVKRLKREVGTYIRRQDGVARRASYVANQRRVG